MYEIKKIQIWPFARSVALLFTAAMVVIPIGAVFFISVVEGLSYGGFDVEDFFEIIFDEDFLIGYFVVIPVTAIISLAAGSLSAWVYNLVSEKIGGIVLNIDYHQENPNSVQNVSESVEQNKQNGVNK